ncbi:hypothetical protein [Mucilaginibacter sp. HD30]
MSKVFFLPKAEELKGLEITKPSSTYTDIFILDPSLVVQPRWELDKPASAANITRQIQGLAEGDEALFLLYHVGNSASLDVQLRALAPSLFSRRYSAHSSGKANYTKIIATIKDIHFASLPFTPEALIREFFLDRDVVAKQALLQQCQLPAGIPDTLPDSLRTAEEAERYQTAFDKFKVAWGGRSEDCVFQPEFIAAQKELRVALLGA